ncbi:hypothetical protein [Chondrinema litorale]|uniref:hypothetical protein n=1 Tax=Chondrinema litorale TaxID=2994555 RepID=UPI002542ED2B|nr:hypothetical protein [Chondrinema litorale]UZR92906.1 hypothetical protein OQ292_13675 [Chondrinema litorale]
MNKIDTSDRKQVLLDQAKVYQKHIRDNVNDIYDNVESKGKKVLVIGGVLVAAYSILDLIIRFRKTHYHPEPERHIEYRDAEHPPVDTRPKKESFIIKSIKEYIATFLLALARQTLTEVIEAIKNKKDDSEVETED